MHFLLTYWYLFSPMWTTTIKKLVIIWLETCSCLWWNHVFFSIWVSFQGHWRFIEQQGKGGDHPYSSHHFHSFKISRFIEDLLSIIHWWPLPCAFTHSICNLLVSYFMRFIHLGELVFDWTSNGILIAAVMLNVTHFFKEKLQPWTCIKYYHMLQKY